MHELFVSIKGCEGQRAGETSSWGSVLCGLDKRQALFVRGCYAWFYDEALKKKERGWVSRRHLHGQSWHWEERVAELCACAVPAG